MRATQAMLPIAAERAAGLLTTHGGGPGPTPARVATAVATHVHGFVQAPAALPSSTILDASLVACATVRSGSMRVTTALPTSLQSELHCYSPHMVVALGRLQLEWQASSCGRTCAQVRHATPSLICADGCGCGCVCDGRASHAKPSIGVLSC